MNKPNLTPAHLRHLGTIEMLKMSGWTIRTVISIFATWHLFSSSEVADFALGVIAALVAVVCMVSLILHFQSAAEFFDEADIKDGIKTPEDFVPTDWSNEIGNDPE